MNVNKGTLKSMHEMASRAIDALNMALSCGLNAQAEVALEHMEGLEVMLDTLHYEADLNDQGDEA